MSTFSINTFTTANQSHDGWTECSDLLLAVRDRKCISPGVFKGGYRNKANAIGASWIMLDFDEGKPTLEEAKTIYADYVGAIYTTRNHRKIKTVGSTQKPACDRYRVILKLSRVVNADEYSRVYGTFKGVDPAARDVSRFYYPRDPNGEVIELTGTKTVDVDAAVGNVIRLGTRVNTLTSLAGKAASVGADIGAVVADAVTKCEEPNDPQLAADAANIVATASGKWSGDDDSLTGIAEHFNKSKRYAFNEALNFMRWENGRWLQVTDTDVLEDIVNWATKGLGEAIVSRNKDLEDRYYRIRNGRAPLVLAALKPRCNVPFKAFREVPWELNCPNGIVDLKTGKIRPHTRNYCLHQTGVEYDPSADMTSWQAFMASTLDPERAEYMRKLLGYAMTGTAEREMFTLLLGDGANGKSTMCNTIEKALGEYVGHIQTAVLEHGTGNTSGLKPWLLQLVGKRLVFANEPSEGLRIADSVIKELGSRDPIPARGLYMKKEELIIPTWLLVIRANHRPAIRPGDHGTWRRVKEVDFMQKFADNPGFADTLDAKGVLRWLIEGAVEYHKSGLTDCKAVADAVASYKAESDNISAWANERLSRNTTHTERLCDVNADYQSWCKSMGTMPFGSRRLTMYMDREYKRVTIGRAQGWIGVKIDCKVVDYIHRHPTTATS